MYDRPFRTGAGYRTTEGMAERKRQDENVKRDLLEAFDERGADAFIVAAWGSNEGSVKEYSLIKFTDPDCRE